jgi:hypothetical protein
LKALVAEDDKIQLQTIVAFRNQKYLYHFIPQPHVCDFICVLHMGLTMFKIVSLSMYLSVCLSIHHPFILYAIHYGSATLAGLSNTLLNRLQSVLHAAARLKYSARKYDHVNSLPHDLHWLRVPERIAYLLAVLAFRCRHGTAPPYLSDELSPVADDDSRRRLRSANTVALVFPRTKHSTIGDRAFPVAAARVWNSLPPLVLSSPSLSVFKRRLKIELFSRSYHAA